MLTLYWWWQFILYGIETHSYNMIYAALGNIIGTLLVARLEIKFRAIGFAMQLIANLYWTYTYVFVDYNFDMAIIFGSFLIIAIYGLWVIRSAFFGSRNMMKKYGNKMFVDEK